MKVIMVIEVIACDVSPVAMFNAGPLFPRISEPRATFKAVLGAEDVT